MTAALQDLFMPLVGDAARRVQGAAKKLRQVDPLLYETLMEAKIAVTTGFLPRGGGLDAQDPVLRGTLEWLARAGILEWVHRNPM